MMLATHRRTPFTLSVDENAAHPKPALINTLNTCRRTQAFILS